MQNLLFLYKMAGREKGPYNGHSRTEHLKCMYVKRSLTRSAAVLNLSELLLSHQLKGSCVEDH